MEMLKTGAGSSSVRESEAAFSALAAGDWAGGWLLLAHRGGGECPACCYNRAICLAAAGEWEAALSALSPAERLLSAKRESGVLPAVDAARMKSLIREPTGPPFIPLSPAIADAAPRYALFRALWLKAVCLGRLGRRGEAEILARRLEEKHGRHGLTAWLEQQN